jgi:hypothetical protein
MREREAELEAGKNRKCTESQALIALLGWHQDTGPGSHRKACFVGVTSAVEKTVDGLTEGKYAQNPWTRSLFSNVMTVLPESGRLGVKMQSPRAQRSYAPSLADATTGKMAAWFPNH